MSARCTVPKLRRLPRVAANGVPRLARSAHPLQALSHEHQVGLFADRTRHGAARSHVMPSEHVDEVHHGECDHVAEPDRDGKGEIGGEAFADETHASGNEPLSTLPEVVLCNQLQIAADTALAADHQDAAAVVTSVGNTGADGHRVVGAAERPDA